MKHTYPKADLGKRFLAYFVDAMIGIVIIMVGYVPLIIGIATESEAMLGLGLILFMIAFILFFVHVLIKDGMKGGQSYGKRIAGIMVVNLETNQPCSMGKSALRNIILQLVGVIDWIFIFINDKNGQRLGDQVASTQVISVDDYNNGGFTSDPDILDDQIMND